MTASPPSERLFSWPARLTWAVGLGTAVGYANTSATSWINSALIKDRGLSIENAGFAVSVELLTMGMVMILLSPAIVRLPRKPLFVAALFAMVATQAVSLVAPGYVGLLLSRAASGVCFGVLYTIAIANGATSSTPQRTFAGAAAIALFVGTLFNPLMGYGADLGGLGGSLAALVCYCLILSVPLLFMKTPSASLPLAEAPMTKRKLDLLAAVLVLAVMGVMTVASNGTLLFTVEIARQVGLEGATLGSGLAVVSLLSAGGGIAGSKIGTRFGTLAPLIIGLIALGLLLFGFTLVQTQMQFWIGITAIVALFWFLSPYVFGLAVQVDPDGRIAAMTGSAKILCSAFGAAGASIIAGRFGLPMVGLVSLILCGITIGIAIILVRHLSGQQKK